MDNLNISAKFKESDEYYTTDLEYFHKELSEESERTFGRTTTYVQQILLRDIQRRIKEKDFHLKHSLEYCEAYKKRLSEAVRNIDAETIMGCSSLYIEHKMYLLKLKKGGEIRDELEFRNGRIYLGDISLYNAKRGKCLSIEVINIIDGQIVMEGRSGLPFDEDDYKICLVASDGEKYPCNNFSKYDLPSYVLGELVMMKRGFKVAVDIRDGLKIGGEITFNGVTYPSNIRFGKWSKLTNNYKYSYYMKGNSAIYVKDRSICVSTSKSRKFFEDRFARALLKQQKADGIDRTVDVSRRKKALRRRNWKRKEIWLFTDRVNVANENAEFLFRYVSSIKPEGVKAYYVISRESPDYERMKKIGNVVDHESEKFLRLFLMADKYITSQTTPFILYPTQLKSHEYRDLIPDNVIYLQHGVMEKDLSDSQNKLLLNLRMFVTSAKPEYDALIAGNYGYTEREARLTGLARHDQIAGFAGKKGKCIVLAPTWRRQLASKLDRTKGGRVYNEAFRSSDFFNFYNGIMNDTRVLEAMRKNGYTGVFKPHPNMMTQVNDFDYNDVFSPYTGEHDYAEQFEDVALLLTDYSSIAMEYALIKRPVIYAQFDVDTFYENHTYSKGFFEYERDGFGPVCYDFESTVRELVHLIENGCEMEPKYLERISDFFTFFDDNNCKRIYEAVRDIHD